MPALRCADGPTFLFFSVVLDDRLPWSRLQWSFRSGKERPGVVGLLVESPLRNLAFFGVFSFMLGVFLAYPVQLPAGGETFRRTTIPRSRLFSPM